MSDTRSTEYGTELNETSNSVSKHKHSRTGTNTSSDAWYGSGIRQTKQFDVEFGPAKLDKEESNIEFVYIPPKREK